MYSDNDPELNNTTKTAADRQDYNPSLSILVLDDDGYWLDKHTHWLRQVGFICRPTRLAQKALELAKTDRNIKFALIDEILFVPPIPAEVTDRERQRWQGQDVIREIVSVRPDVKCIVVTSAPRIGNGDNVDGFRQATEVLRRQPGVIDLFHKQDIRENQQRAYEWLVEQLRMLNLSVTTTDSKRERWSKEHQMLKELWELQLEKIKEIHRAFIIESDGDEKLHLKQRLFDEQTIQANLKQEIEEIEQNL